MKTTTIFSTAIAFSVISMSDVLCAAQLDRNATLEASMGWMSVSSHRMTHKLSASVKSVTAYNGFHVVQLEPEGYIVTADNDELEPVVAFSDKGTFVADPENPLWGLLTKDMPARVSALQSFQAAQKANSVAVTQVASLSAAAQQSSAARTKWELLREKGRSVQKVAATAVQPASTAATAAVGGTDPITDPMEAPMPAVQPIITGIKTVDGHLEVTHNSTESVSILCSYDQGTSWQVVDSGIISPVWISKQPANELSSWIKVELDGLVDSMSVNFLRNPPPIQPVSSDDPMFDAAATNQPAMAASLGSVSDVRIAPLIQSQWSQSAAGGYRCYNYYTPNNSVCGCVATAMAQLMRYHRWPTAGIGLVTKNVTINGATATCTTRGGNGSGGAYDWNNMPLTPSTAPYNLAQWQMIGSICYDAGVSVSMNYTLNSSGAQPLNIETGFKNVFGYQNARTYWAGGNIATTNLTRILQSNLAAGYPVLLAIYNTSSGHSVPTDGFGYSGSTPYYHINMGWGGFKDAWYNLPTVDDGIYNFTSVELLTYNVFPTGTGEIIAGRVLSTVGAPIQGATVSATSGPQSYTGTTDSKGYYGVRVPSGASYTICASASGFSSSSMSGIAVGSSSSYNSSGNYFGADFALSSFCFSAVALTNSVILRWSLPVACGMSNNTVYVRWSTNSYPTNASAGNLIYAGTNTMFVHSNLVSSGTATNYYTIFGNNGSPYADLGANNNAYGSPDPGKAHLFWRNQASGVLYNWQLATNGTRRSWINPVLTSLAGYDCVAAADINGDGQVELFWRNQSTGILNCWFMNPDGTRASFARTVPSSLTGYDCVAASDINGDGKAELFWRSQVTGILNCWFMNPDGTRASFTRTVPSSLTGYDCLAAGQ